ncbi:transient receptor potential cation channel family member painless [Ptiloglossa arizonensis]|uniref:transient receptor potential cation channel family member painless n=1 Tax=Ptiloglossa arizonensis TaxID=3350558 RepID=UPI003F9F4306
MDPEDEFMQMHLLHDYTPVLARSYYRQLLDCLHTKDIRKFKSLVEQSLRRQPPSININHAYQDRADETFLDIACKNGLPEFVSFLLEKGANVNRVNEAHNRGPIHFATEKGHTDVLRILLDEPTINPNLEAGQQTALHIAVKTKDLRCAELLLDKGASPNIPNSKGLTALHMAAMKGQRNMVDLILQKSRHALDLDNYKDYNDQTTRDVLQEKLADVPLPSVQKRGVNVHDLKYYLNANDETNFLKCLSVVQDDVVNNVAEDLLEMAAQRNFKETIIALLERVKGTGCNLEKAANLAIQRGSPDILRELLNTDIEVGSDLLLNACLELGVPGSEGTENMPDRLECLKLILDREDVDVRCTDNKGNTPLHYAARADCLEAVTLLLEKGSYIGHMNAFGVPPVADISVSTLSQYFDDCIQTRKMRTNEYTIEFDYKSLMPHDVADHTEHRNKRTIDQQKREMDIFQYIANSSTLKHLLNHPLLSSFLYLKWHRIRYIFYINFVFYFLVYLLLNTYILNTTYQDVDTHQTESTFMKVLRVFTFIAIILLTLREMLQLVLSPCNYLSNFENWLEMLLIFLSYAIFGGADIQVAAVTILLSAWKLVILIGQHPRMSTDIEMFKTVFRNFVRFLFPYAFLILAFALAFFALFKDSDNSNDNNDSTNNFQDTAHSLFKTIIMLTGEFDANDIPFTSRPILSHLVFILFVFLIAIVLFNLLNGLAVSDTAEILGKAKLIGLISRVRLIAYIEKVAVNAPFTHGSHCLLCNDFLYSCRHKPLAFLVKKILLFPNYLKNGKLSIKSYDNLKAFGNKIYYKKQFDQDSKDKIFPTFDINPHVIKQAKEIISKRSRESDTEKMICELRKVKDRLALIELNLNTLKHVIENNNFNVRKDNEN